jgi:hypothetical protein
MTATLEAPKQASRLADAEYQARLERVCAYVEQLERADKDADKGSLQRAADLTAIYEDKRWVDDMPESEPPRKRGFRIVRDSREQFAKWAKEHLTSSTTGNPLKRTVALGLLDTQDVVRSISTPLETEAIGAWALHPLVKLIKEDRSDEVTAVWKRAVKLAEAEGQDLPGPALIKRARADHDKAHGIKAPVSKRTVASYEHKVEQGFDWLVRHNTPEENRALLRRLAERLKAEHQWARGEQAS